MLDHKMEICWIVKITMTQSLSDIIYWLVLSIGSLNNIQSPCKNLIVLSANKTLFTTLIMFFFYKHFTNMMNDDYEL